MGRRGPRQICFACSEIVDGKLVSEIIDRTTLEEAKEEFKARFGVDASICHGPFYKKRTGVLQHQAADIAFSGKTGEFIYDGWLVTVMYLTNPAGCGYVFYERRIDDKKMPKPQATIVRLDDMEENV